METIHARRRRRLPRSDSSGPPDSPPRMPSYPASPAERSSAGNCRIRLRTRLGVEGDRSIRTPVSRGRAQQRNGWASWSGRRKNTYCQGFHANNRQTIFRPVVRICGGTLISAWRNVLKSIRNSFRFSSPCRSCQRPCSGSTKAHRETLRLHVVSSHHGPICTSYNMRALPSAETESGMDRAPSRAFAWILPVRFPFTARP